MTTPSQKPAEHAGGDDEREDGNQEPTGQFRVGPNQAEQADDERQRPDTGAVPNLARSRDPRRDDAAGDRGEESRTSEGEEKPLGIDSANDRGHRAEKCQRREVVDDRADRDRPRIQS